LPDFFGTKYQIWGKYTKRQPTIRHTTIKYIKSHKITQKAKISTKIFHSKAFHTYQNWDFCYENIPSDNPEEIVGLSGWEILDVHIDLTL
jgi:hypothetical protein